MNSRAGLLRGRWDPGSTGNISDGWATLRVPHTFFWIFCVMVKMFCVSSLDTYSWENVIMPANIVTQSFSHKQCQCYRETENEFTPFDQSESSNQRRCGSKEITSYQGVHRRHRQAVGTLGFRPASLWAWLQEHFAWAPPSCCDTRRQCTLSRRNSNSVKRKKRRLKKLKVILKESALLAVIKYKKWEKTTQNKIKIMMMHLRWS